MYDMLSKKSAIDSRHWEIGTLFTRSSGVSGFLFTASGTKLLLTSSLAGGASCGLQREIKPSSESESECSPSWSGKLCRFLLFLILWDILIGLPSSEHSADSAVCSGSACGGPSVALAEGWSCDAGTECSGLKVEVVNRVSGRAPSTTSPPPDSVDNAYPRSGYAAAACAPSPELQLQ
ncbi:hypothetical protein EYF80_009081 [Liparis tanakae]|uniref:Uncharacterized protein n=1 Tax=Liparis tanakae TaxID=230148 RepID=A0A4Z2IRS3_9TELE|nr:hypothetical protein EYF80_009081 [Liparis tanakae]